MPMGVGALILIPFLWAFPRNQQEDPEQGIRNGDDDIDHRDNTDEEVDEDGADEPSQEIEHGLTTRPPSVTSPDTTADKPSWFSRLKSTLFGNEDEGEDEGYIPNYRLLPIFSGVVIPFSILLEIPGLTDHWYIRTDGNATVETRPNTTILNVGLGFSMLCALIANISIIMRFLEKGEVKKMTILAIIALTLHDAINITTVVSFGVEHRADDGFTYGPSYWATVCSTIASSVTNVSLIWDLWKTPNFAKSGSGLTRKQRSLVIIVIILLCYIALGALANSYLVDLDFINAMYFTVVCIETVGYGDIVPLTTGARIFTCAYIAVGIMNLGVAVAMCRETVFENLEVSYRKRMATLRKARSDHRKWRMWERAWKHAVEARLQDMDVDYWVHDTEPDNFLTKNVDHPNRNRTPTALIGRIMRGFKPDKHHNLAFRHCGQVRGIAYGHPGTHLNIEAFSPAELEAIAVEAGIPLDAFFQLQQNHNLRVSKASEDTTAAALQFLQTIDTIPSENEPVSPIPDEMEKMSGMLTKFALASTGIAISANETPHVQKSGSSGHDQSSEFQRPAVTPTESAHGRGELPIPMRSVDIPNFKQVVESEEAKAFWAKLIVACSLFIVFWMAGSAIFSATEGWSYSVGMYFTFITFTTTGFGDYTPKTPAGRSIFVLWALLGLGTMTILISVLQEAYSSRYKNAFHSDAFHKAVEKYKRRRKMPVPLPPTSPPLQPPSQAPDGQVSTSAIKESHESAQKQLEELPAHILRECKSFYRHIQYFMKVDKGHSTYQEGGRNTELTMPIDLRAMLDEISRAQTLGDRVKHEILQDEESRNTLFMLSFEKALREMIYTAEKSLMALAERDRLRARYQQQSEDQSRPPSPEGTS